MQIEEKRLQALTALNLLDTAPAETFDRITRMASKLFGLPIAAVSLTDSDRQWFKSRVGVDHFEIPREKAPCAEVATTNQALVIEDLLADDCYSDSLLAQSGIRFYAGHPLVTRDGFGLGALCVLGVEPRTVGEDEKSILRDMAAMVMDQIELSHSLGRIDPSSRMPNRSQFFEDWIDLERDRADLDGHCVVLELVEPDSLTALTRAKGPAFLDDLLKTAAEAVRRHLPGLTVYHTGPTQFALPVFSVEINSLMRKCSRCTTVLADSLRTRLGVSLISPSMGLAPVRLGATSAQEALRMATGAAQSALGSTKPVVLHDASLDAAHARRYMIFNDFPRALDAIDQLSVWYQPRIEIASGDCVGAEALLRWNHPVEGPISPAEFMPLIENTPVIDQLTSWVARQAARDCRSLMEAGHDLVVSVNLSANNLVGHDISSELADIAREAGLLPHSLEFEVTESAMLHDRSAYEQLQRLRNAGFRIAIDDFGTGYSSLSYLDQVPADVIKIDRSFIRQMETSNRSEKMLTAMVALGLGLGMHVVAEGVETADQLRIVAASGCHEVQGYFYGRPMTFSDLISWCSERRREALGLGPLALAPKEWAAA